MNIPVRALAIILAVAFAIGAPAFQNATGWGLTAAEFAQSGNTTLRAAGYAFSIWGLLYLGFAIYAAYQVLPRNASNAALKILGWPSALAIAGCGAWILAAAVDARWPSVAIIVLSAAVLTTGLLRAGKGKSPSVLEWLMVWWPLGLLAGWLTIASAVNILTVMTAEGLLRPGQAPLAAAGGLLVVLAVALSVLRASGLIPYAAAVAWGFVAVWAAERGDQPLIAALALGCAVVLGLFAAWMVRPNAGRR